jgi:hypothetical protein
MYAPNGHFSLCRHCGRPLRQALPCPLCGRSCCRWKCYTEHVDRHRGSGEDGPTHRGEGSSLNGHGETIFAAAAGGETAGAFN